MENISIDDFKCIPTLVAIGLLVFGFLSAGKSKGGKPKSGVSRSTANPGEGASTVLPNELMPMSHYQGDYQWFATKRGGKWIKIK